MSATNVPVQSFVLDHGKQSAIAPGTAATTSSMRRTTVLGKWRRSMESKTSARPARGGAAESGAVPRGEDRCWLGMLAAVLATVLSGLGGACVGGSHVFRLRWIGPTQFKCSSRTRVILIFENKSEQAFDRPFCTTPRS